ncbi:hypothetical protein NDU88_002448 [Pleurodeles waltl]|uniref:Uncharacterized protein n=1 Tax=Pleurodeles waltl TaxID=8319 RepID=A0AAV7SF73_PLEWA|nr:hypothetical protein NDU88_002448 [Pleurodeles waltl]
MSPKCAIGKATCQRDLLSCAKERLGERRRFWERVVRVSCPIIVIVPYIDSTDDENVEDGSCINAVVEVALVCVCSKDVWKETLYADKNLHECCEQHQNVYEVAKRRGKNGCDIRDGAKLIVVLGGSV